MSSCTERHETSRWEEDTISRILTITSFPPPPPSDPPTTGETFLSTLRKTLSSLPPPRAVQYVAQALHSASFVSVYDESPRKHAILAHITRVLSSTLLVLLTRAPNVALPAYVDALLASPFSQASSLQTLAAAASASDSLDRFLLPVLDCISSRLLSATQAPPDPSPTPTLWASHPHALLSLLSTLLAAHPEIPPTALAALGGSKSPAASGKEAWMCSLLGPALGVGVWESVVLEAVFDKQSLLQYRSDRVASAFNTLRDGSAELQSLQFAILKTLMKAKGSNLRLSARDLVLDSLAHLLKSNAKKAQIHGGNNPLVDGPDSLVFNISVLLLQLCARFTTQVTTASPLGAVDPRSVVLSPLIDLGSETLLSATNADIESWVDVRNIGQQAQYAAVRAQLGDALPTAQDSESAVRDSLSATGPGGKAGTTQMFALALVGFHIGIAPHIERYLEMSRAVSRMEESDPRGDVARSRLFGTQGIVLDPRVVDLALPLFGYLAEWLLALLTLPANLEAPPVGGDVVGSHANVLDSGLVFPLGIPHPALALIPEYFVADMAQFLAIWLRIRSSGSSSAVSDIMTRVAPFFLATLNAPAHVKNPYVRGRMAEVLFLAPVESYAHVLKASPPLRSWVPQSLIGFYVDVEASGGHSSFYDKFSVRHHLAQIMMRLRSSGEIEYVTYVSSPEGLPIFVRFANALMNDATFAVDESLSADAVNAGMFVKNAEDSIDLLGMLVEDPVSRSLLLTANGLQTRLARLLNHITVVLLSAPDNTAEVEYDRRGILRGVASMFGRMAGDDTFISDAAGDERNCNPDVYAQLVSTLRTEVLLNEGDILQVESVFASIAEAVQTGLASGVPDDVEIPDEFLDPLTYELMEDPVTLPASDMVVDRRTIIRQLLSDPVDPWTKTPLTEEDCVPATELKARIQEFVSQANSTSGAATGAAAAASSSSQ